MEHRIHKKGRYSTAFKQEVATEALKGTKTIQQIASDYQVSPIPQSANFFSDFSASAQLASLRAAPSLRSGRSAYATKPLKKCID